MREIEALAIRNRDIYFGSPTRIHIRKEYAKTLVARGIYISDEATKELRDWIDWKYRTETGKTKKTDDLVFAVAPRRTKDYDPNLMYANIEREFIKTLELAGFTERKENSRVHTITLRSFRRFVQSTISDTAGKDYAEWFLGHKKSPYYTKKETDLRDIYSTKCMKYLTFLDYSLLEASGKSIDAELQVKDKQIQSLASQMQSRGQEIEMLKQELKSWEEVAEKMKVYVDKRKKEEERQRRLYTEIDKHYPGWREKFHARLGRPGDEIVDELMAVMPDQL